MIELYVGLIGSGKTVSAVHRALEYVASGGMVVTNIDLQLPACERILWAWWRWRLQPAQIRLLGGGDMAECYKRVPEGTQAKPVLFMLDEASEWFDSLESSRALEGFLSFLRQSRKVAIDCVFITQDASLIQRRIRALCSAVYWHRNLAACWASGFGFRLPSWLRVIHVTQFLRDGKTVARRFSRPNVKEVWQCYKTTELYRDLGVERGVQTDFRKAATEEGDDMTKGWKVGVVGAWVAVAALLVMLLRGQQSGAAAVAVPAPFVNPFASRAAAKPSVSRVYGRFQGAGRGWVCIDGRAYRVGDLTTQGRVVAVGPWGAALTGDGTNVLLYAERGLPPLPQPKSVPEFAPEDASFPAPELDSGV